jgi:hypothetical protein
MEKRGLVVAIVLIIGIAMFANFLGEKYYPTGNSVHNSGWTWKLDATGPSFGSNQPSSLNLCANPCLTKEDCSKYELPKEEKIIKPGVGEYDQEHTYTYYWECMAPVCLDETTNLPAYECSLKELLTVRKIPWPK